MLVALSIRSFVLIDRLDLDVGQGFTALTGETGAGKSIILDALGLVLGGQANRKMVRAGCDEASVTAEFALSETHSVWAILAELAIDGHNDETLTLRRTLSTRGPSRAFVNDQAVSAASLERIGEALVEIHSQHSASALMRPSSHRGLLDTYAGLKSLLNRVKAFWETFAAAREARQAYAQAAKQAEAQREWLEFAVNELEKLAPEQGEAKHLLAQRAALMQAERLTEAAGSSRCVSDCHPHPD